MHRWKFSLLATAAALSTGLYFTDASALTLGRVTVQSALGEPLRAQVALPNITPAEADSLHVSVASPEVFRAQRLEFSPVVNGIHLELKRGAGGSMTLQLSSNKTVNEPFIDLVIDAAWNAGHLVRSYTLLFDPPALRSAPAPAPIAPQTSASTAPAPAAAAPVRAPRVSTTIPARAPSEPTETEVKVRPGDTAGALANAHRPSGISLDQMLVAMVRANPQAFIDGNANRLRAGAVLHMPGRDAAEATPAAEARRIIAAQSQDFNAYRNRLAGAAPAAAVEAASRSASGKVQTEVAESKPAAASPDILTLSKADAAKDVADAKTAETKEADQTQARLQELAKNISDLKDVSQDAATPAPAAEQAPAASDASGAPADAPAQADAAPAEEPAAPAAATAEATPEPPAPAVEVPVAPPAPPAAPAAETKPKPASAPVAPPPPEPSLLDTLTEQPMLSGGALALLLLLLAWGGYRWKQGRSNPQGPETTFDEDHPDSFFAESGGQEVDTSSSDLTTGSTSTLYSPSQLDQIGDVDPVAEADVYLAYGKDPEAEAILKEAALQHPERVAIRAKLAEIYAKRQDRVALESVARKIHELTQGQGPEWEHVRQLGAELDDGNALYNPASTVTRAAELPAAAPVLAEVPVLEAHAPSAAPTPAAPDSLLPEINLDLDLDDGHSSLPSGHGAPAAAAAGGAFVAAAVGAAQQALNEPLEPEAQELTLPEARAEEPVEALHAAEPLGQTLDFPTDDLALADSGPMPLTKKEVAPTQPASLAATQPATLEFDLGELSLDLDKIAEPASSEPAAAPADTPSHEPLPTDPLATKLALAEEFKAIGDSEGARSLIEEVMAQADGDLKAQAQRLLDTLS